MTGSADHVARNREFWNAQADEYQARHGEALAKPAWCVWQIPEEQLNVLDPVEGKDVLEFGCGGGQWSVNLAKQGARAIGLDLSDRQLEHARGLAEREGVEVRFVQGSGEDVPLPDASFDIVFCDHGAFNFADPHRTVPEAARLLRPGGQLAFSHITPLAEIAWDGKADSFVDRLNHDYFGLGRTEDDDGSVAFNAPYGEWLRLFTSNGLVVEDLIEIQAPEGATNTYEWPYEWCRRWPGEQIWRLRKS